MEELALEAEQDLKQVELDRNDHNAVLLNDDIYNLLRELRMLREERKVIEEREVAVKEELLSMMKDNEVICSENGVVLATAKFTNTTRFDTEAFKHTYPDMYRMYTTTKQTRTFLLKG